jgi:hypothetical protein
MRSTSHPDDIEEAVDEDIEDEADRKTSTTVNVRNENSSAR